ncbi:hypothetical protein TNCV_1051421 [Trichonephila clavipes]|nr:hypothetical protein TNCV_1051421 [Trichonephila clavipes]
MTWGFIATKKKENKKKELQKLVTHISRDRTLFLRSNAWFVLKTVSTTVFKTVIGTLICCRTHILKHMLRGTSFEQDGAPSHIATLVNDLLRTSFGEDRVLRSHFNHDCPPSSPDLNPSD